MKTLFNQKFKIREILILGLICVPVSAIFANAGTPVLFAGVIHFFFLNFLIGIMEGFWVRSTLESHNIRRAWFDPYVRMILANYFSAFVGMMLVLYLSAPLKIDEFNMNSEWRGHLPFLRNLLLIFAIMYPISVVCEMFFISTFSKNKSASLIFDLFLSAKFNLVSHVLLFGFYYSMQASVLKYVSNANFVQQNLPAALAAVP